MSQGTIRNFHFREMRGDYSTRINANGDYKLLAEEPVLYEGFLAQTEKIYQEIQRLKKLPCLTPEQKNLFENHVREYGSRQHLLQHASRFAFEKVFVQIANALLPAAYFMAITNEARNIWQSLGYHTPHIVDLSKARKRARKLRQHHVFKRIANAKRSAAIVTASEDYSI